MTRNFRDFSQLWEDLAQPGGRIVLLVIDGAGDLPHRDTGRSALETAVTPNLDRLAAGASCGRLEMVGPGITPGSGPGHLALFGYDPVHHAVGRGVLSALGIDFELRAGDIAARVNFATKEPNGCISDRRAGRIATDTNRRLCHAIRHNLQLDFTGEVFLETVSEHRAVVVLRGNNLAADITDTDPHMVGAPPHAPEARSASSQATADLVAQFIQQAEEALSGEPHANTILLRGFECYQQMRSLEERFGLRGLCLAVYPMYRGVSRLVGMEVPDPPSDLHEAVSRLTERYGEWHDFYFLHFKETDSRGEDGDFAGKVAAIERFDAELPSILELDPEVIAITADHSTPATLSTHSWHPVPLLIHGPTARPDEAARFTERECCKGELGLRPGLDFMGLALSHARRLRKFGA